MSLPRRFNVGTRMARQLRGQQTCAHGTPVDLDCEYCEAALPCPIDPSHSQADCTCGFELPGDQ